jgi:hypothetical protein
MKPPLSLLTIFSLVAFLDSSFAARLPAAGRKLTDINVIPTRVLQRSISPKFYKSLLVSPVQGWIVVRANLSGTRLSGARVIRSDLKGLYDPLALQLAKEAVIAGNYSIERPNLGSSVLLHLLVYQIADGTMVLSFAHLDGPGGDQNAVLWLRTPPGPERRQMDRDPGTGKSSRERLGGSTGIKK